LRVWFAPVCAGSITLWNLAQLQHSALPDPVVGLMPVQVTGGSFAA
jgi:hypothetical protein